MTGVGRGWEAVHLAQLDAIPVLDEVVWHPVRRRLGIRAFGINAYTSERVGGLIVEEHDETGGGAGGHEELYVVVSGRATFTLGGETLDAPAGSLVFIADPNVRRRAVAEEQGTVVLAIGGEPGSAYQVSPWEYYFAAAPAFKGERWEEAIGLIQEGLGERPGNAALLYNLACAEARAGRSDDAVAHLRQAIDGDAAYAETARADSDFDAIRAAPGFPREARTH